MSVNLRLNKLHHSLWMQERGHSTYAATFCLAIGLLINTYSWSFIICSDISPACCCHKVTGACHHHTGQKGAVCWSQCSWKGCVLWWSPWQDLWGRGDQGRWGGGLHLLSFNESLWCGPTVCCLYTWVTAPAFRLAVCWWRGRLGIFQVTLSSQLLLLPGVGRQ